MDPDPKPFVPPVWARRRQAASTATDAAFTAMRAKDGRAAPQSWINPVKPNTTQSQKERPAAGHMVNGRPSQLRYRQASTGVGVRAPVQMKRTTGVTQEDRAMAETGDDKFFDDAKAQDAIERGR